MYHYHKDATAFEYDNKFAYRFMYYLRTYATHCEKPIDDVRDSKKGLELLVSREKLLKDRKMKKILRNEITLLPEMIDIVPFIFKMHASIVDINNKILQARFDSEMRDICLWIIDYAKKFSSKEGLSIVINYSEKKTWDNAFKPNSNISFGEVKLDIRLLRFDLAQELLTFFAKNTF